jgi:glycosidase
VGSFSDSNGDGIGDLRGIINRFDYLNDGDPNSGVSLGIEGIWLSPILISPSYHKYDVSDYYLVDPKFGTEDDLKELITLCHERGVKLIMDFVINHTSTAHPWFKEFLSAHRNEDSTNPYYDYYSWSNEPAPGRTFCKMGSFGGYYEGNFSSAMPELNYDNDVVRQEMVKAAKYYLDMGMDGFRFDAAKYIYYGDDTRSADFWVWYMNELRTIKPDMYAVAEVWSGDASTFPYFTSVNCFNFSMAQSEGHISSAAKGNNVNSFTKYVDQYLDSIHAMNPNAMLCTFIANHDTDRAAGFLPASMGRAQVAANLSILTPGSPFIYYGEEIGMLGSRGGANTDANRRLGMLWGDGDTVKDPEGANYSGTQSNGTVVDQLPNGKSLFNHYKKLIMIRKANPEIAYGEFTPIVIEDSKVGGFLSTYEGSTVAVFHNTTTESVVLDLATLTDVSLTQLQAYAGMGTATLEGTTLTIAPQTSVVLK